MKNTLRNIEILLHAIIIITLGTLTAKPLLIGMYFPGMIIIFFLIACLSVSFGWKRLKISPRDARKVCYYLEGIALLILWATYTTLGNIEIAHLSFIGSVTLPFIGFISSLKTYTPKKRATLR